MKSFWRLRLIFGSECVNGVVRLFSECYRNQKSVAGIGYGGTDLNRRPLGYEPDVRSDFFVN